MSSQRQGLYEEQLSDSKIRLLEILVPSRKADCRHEEAPISCRLNTFPTTKCPNYTCLSYAWHEPLSDGSPESRIVSVNGVEVAVRPNLATALRQYVKAVHDGIAVDYKPTWFWIDALCINQSSLEERSAQVSRMHQIYRFATKVLVWLGPDPENEVYYVREFFRALLQRYWVENGDINYTEDFLRKDQQLSFAGTSLPPYEAEIWRRTVRFWDRAWFFRAWVQQEVALAQRAEIWCGSVMFTLLELAEISRFHSLSGLSWTLLPLRHGVAIPDKTYEGRALGGSPIRLSYMRNKVLGFQRWETEDQRRYADRLTGASKKRSESESGMSMLRIFANQLHLCLTTEASDERDKVFALLMVMKQIASTYGYEELPLCIDYTKPTAQVFREAAAWVIEESGWVGIFAIISQRRTLADVHSRGLPSWVLDLSMPSSPPVQIRSAYQHRLDKATRLLTDANRPRVSGRVLHISIKRIGTVTHVGNSHNEMIDDGDFEETAKLLLKCPAHVSNNGKTRIDWFMDTLLGRNRALPCDDSLRVDFNYWLKFLILRRLQRDYRDGRIKRASDFLATQPTVQQLAIEDETRTMPTFDDWKRILGSMEEMEDIRAQSSIRFGRNGLEIQERRLILLQELGFPHCPVAKLLAIGPEATEVGDEVCLVAGSMMPVVLRRTGEAHCNSTQAYLIGEAHVNAAGEPASLVDDASWQRWHLI